MRALPGVKVRRWSHFEDQRLSEKFAALGRADYQVMTFAEITLLYIILYFRCS
jgi:hypothetical protein